MERSYQEYKLKFLTDYIAKNPNYFRDKTEWDYSKELLKDYIENIKENPNIIFSDAKEILEAASLETYSNNVHLLIESVKGTPSEEPYKNLFINQRTEGIYLYLLRNIDIQINADSYYKIDDEHGESKLKTLLLKRVAELTNGDTVDFDLLQNLLIITNDSLQNNNLLNYTHIPFKNISHPGDKMSKALVTMTPEEQETGELQVIELAQSRKQSQIISTIKFDIDQMKKLGFSHLDSFDLFVMFTCFAIQAGGNKITSVPIIYRTMKGISGNSHQNKNKITPTMRHEILASIEKLRLTPITIDATGICSKYGYVGKGNYVNDYLLACKVVNDGSIMINGAIVEDAIVFYGESPLVEIAKMKNNQIITYEKSLLNVPLNTNRNNIVIPPYLIQRIKTSEHKEVRNEILIDTIIKDCDWTGDRIRLVKIIEKCFDYWRDKCDFIKSYEIEKDGRGKAEKIKFKPTKK